MKIIYNLNGLKWLLVLGTIADHVFNDFTMGHICVCAFFVISGYLMESKKLRKGQLSFTNFAIGNLRFIPAHITMLCVVFAMQVLVMKKYWITSFFCHMFLIQSWIEPVCRQPINGMSWYLSTWIVLTFVFIVLTKIEMSSYKKMTLVMLLGIIVWFLGYNVEDKWWYYYIFPFAHVIDYSLGVCLVHVPQFITDKIQKNAVFFQILSVALFFTTYYLTRINEVDFRYSSNIIYIPCSVFLVCILIYTDASNTKLNKCLHSKLFQFGGKLCMQMFLYHFFFVSVFHHALPQVPFILQFIISVVVTMVVSYYASIYYEKPIVEFLRCKLFSENRN